MTQTEAFVRALVALMLMGAAAAVVAQLVPAPAKPPAAAPAKPAAPAPPAQPPAPIPLAEVPDQAETTIAEIRSSREELAKDPLTERIAAALPQARTEIAALEEQAKRVATGDPSLGEVQKLTAAWQRIRAHLAGWRDDLSKLIVRLEKEEARLDALEQQWTATAGLARAPDAPKAVGNRVQATLDAIKNSRASGQSPTVRGHRTPR